MERDTRVQGHAAGNDGHVTGRHQHDAEGLAGRRFGMPVFVLPVIISVVLAAGRQDTEASQDTHETGTHADGAADDELAADLVLLPGADDRLPVDLRADQVDEFRIRNRQACLIGKSGAVAMDFSDILGVGVLRKA